MAKKERHINWEGLSDKEIMQVRIRDFKLRIPGSALGSCIQRLYAELESKGIQFCPPCYLADEWLCPDREPIMGIPFYLAHPRLKQIEQRMMFEVEGGAEESCTQLLRHECGHALNYAYMLYKRTRWRELFGPFSAKYGDSYHYQPYSRRYVIHLKDNYAQAHPDEDFAETFAVWLTPGSGWQDKYERWPVMKKLRYVDHLMKQVGKRAPVVAAQARPPWSASRMTSSLGAYYDRKRRLLGSEFQGFYDDNLRELFSSGTGGPGGPKASKLLRQYRREIIDNVTRWTGHRKYDIHQLLNRFIFRCDVLKLCARKNPSEDLVGATALLTSVASSAFRVRRRHRRG